MNACAAFCFYEIIEDIAMKNHLLVALLVLSPVALSQTLPPPGAPPRAEGRSLPSLSQQQAQAEASARYRAEQPDSWMVEQVRSQFLASSVAGLASIQVMASNGTVYLQGVVPGTTAKQEAVRLARQVDGVSAVEDEGLVLAPDVSP